MPNLAKIAVFIAACLTGHAVEGLAAEPSPIVVEIESPLASPHPLQGYLRRPNSAGPLPAVVLLHSCGENWTRLDQRWGKQIAAWGYVALTVDSFGPRGLTKCGGGTPGSAPDGQSLDAFRALNFLVGAPFVDPTRVAVLGFARGGRLALLSVEHGAIEQTSPHKFRAAIAFYPDCRAFRGDVTVPTLILIGDRDDWSPPSACRDMSDGRDAMGLSRKRSDSAPIKLIVFPGAYHGFDAPSLSTPRDISGHHLEFNQTAADQSIAAVHEFLDATIGRRE